MTLLEAKEIEPGRFVCTPHPVTLDGQKNLPVDLLPGENLSSFLSRHIDLAQQWEVVVDGEIIPREDWRAVKPLHGQLIEVRGAVNKQALYLIAMVALTYFTFGLGTAAGWGAGAAAGAFGGGMAGTLFAGATFAAGAVIINKVLGPKAPTTDNNTPDPVYSIGAARNAPRPYEPFPLLFGVLRITPDLASNPYPWYQGDDQHIGFVLNAGINVDRIENLANDDTLLTSYDDLTVYTAGFPGMAEQAIPLHTNVDIISGAELDDVTYVTRTSSPDTVELRVDVEYILGGTGTSGKKYYVTETIEVQYRETGSVTWLSFGTKTVKNNTFDVKKTTLTKTVPRGQYDVRVKTDGNGNYTGNNTHKNDFTWVSLVSVQADDTDYRGISRVAVSVRGTGQLSGAMDEIRGIGYARDMPIWDGSFWQTATDRDNGLSNPGAQILQYARGFFDINGDLIAGMGLDDEQIDIEALKAFMLHCTANGYKFDAYVKNVRSHQDMLDTIALAGFGHITWAGGRLSVAWAADGQPLGGVVNMATIKKGQFQVDYTLANAADGIEYTYFDRTEWKPKTIRVPAPGVTVMLNPARLSGEGITEEAHAAELARYHLAQHLYQYKDISYATTLEALSYRRLSVLALAHDLTRWGYGGRVVSAVNNAGVVTVELDEPVPAPATGNAYIGLRIPGEQVYRVFGIVPFVGTSDTLTLVESWPVDAALPGNTDANPAHDTIWIYDFKQTPGYRVRVVAIHPEAGLKGARVAVVPESSEFWTYVKTGEYQVPAVNPLLTVRPTVTNLVVSETTVAQGDTTFTELQVTFDVSGRMAYATVHAALEVDGVFQPLVEVAQTQTRTARWRIPAAGTYAIVVRPYDANGVVGGVASTTYTTLGAELPPPAFDHFTVTELDGGVRKYSFGYGAATIQSPDFAGAEIRYVAGTEPVPDWDTMTPLADGYFTSDVEAVVPVAGTWTFAARPRSTSGLLGDASVITVALAENLGEITEDLDTRLIQETIDRIDADAQVLLDAAQDATDKVSQEASDRAAADLAESQARVNALANERLLWEAAVETEETIRQSEDESLATSISLVSAGSGQQFDSKKIWYFDSDLEAWSGTPTPTIVDGWLRAGDHATNPHLISPAALGIAGQSYRFVKARIKKVGNPPSWDGRLWWQTDVATWETARSATIPEPEFNPDGTATVDWDDVGWWPGTVNRIRIDLNNVQTATDYYLVDWVAVGRPTPGAGVALVQDETTARISGDAAEAAQRSTLAVQLRGNYTGTDVASVTQGLIYSERQARVSADSAEATARQQLAAIVNDGTTGLAAAHAAITAEEQARASGDSAEASARNTLAVQLRGNYTGSDLASVTSGLIFSERVTRATEDSALAQRAEAIEVRLPAGTGGLASEASVTDLATAMANADGIMANDITSLKGQVGGGVNLFPDAAFADGGRFIDWSSLGASGVWSAVTLNLAGDPWHPPGMNNVGMTAATGEGTITTSMFRDFFGPAFPVDPTIDHISSVYCATHRGRGRYFIRWYDAAGAAISNSPQSPETTTAYNGGTSLANWNRPYMVHAAADIPANARTARFLFRAVGNNEVNPYIWWMRPMFEPKRASQTLPSPWVNGVSSAASAFVVESISIQINDPGTGLPSKASAADLTAMGVTVGDHSSEITQLFQTTVQIGAQVVALENPSFEDDGGWGDAVGSLALPADTTWQSATNSPDYTHTGNYSFRVNANAATRNVYNQAFTRLQYGKRYKVSMWVRSWGGAPVSGAYVRPTMRQYDKDGAYLSYTAGAVGNSVYTSTGASFGWTKIEGVYTPPSTVAAAHFAFQVVGLTSGSFLVDDYRVEEISDSEEVALASWSLTFDVNDYVSGVYSWNDGTSSSFIISTDVFGLLKPGGGDALTWSGGVLSADKSGKALKLGAGFGADADPLVIYFGASGAASTRTLVNAVFGITASGKPKLGGTGGNEVSGWISGGTITSSYSIATPSVVSFAVAAGTFVTNGVSISYNAGSNQTTQARSSTVNYYLYYDDGGMTGGTKTLQISTNPNVKYNNPNYVLVGGPIAVTVPASGGGSGPTKPPNCVTVETPLPTHGRAGDVKVGDLLVIGDPVVGGTRKGRVSMSKPFLEECVLFVTENGWLECSRTAPIAIEGGALVNAEDLQVGMRVPRQVNGEHGIDTIYHIEDIGEQMVQHITCENDLFLAGNRCLFYHHNIKTFEP